MFSQFPGLTTAQANKLMGQYGPNLLPQKPPPTKLSILIDQFKNPFVYVLLSAVVITVGIGHWQDAVIIGVAITINTLLGYLQEYKATNALAALSTYLISQVKVKRDKVLLTVLTSHLVPGDIVILNAGDRVPADGKILFTNRLTADESLLTGESMPVNKSVNDPIFMGTIISSGQVVFKVEQTGAATRMGAIATQLEIKRDETPLKRQLNIFSQQILYIVLTLTTIVFVLGLLRGLPLSEIFVTSIALAVSSIPEGLIVSLTIVLAIGMQKILKHKGLVSKLSSAETLGGITVICVDKTGTLTTGKLTVVESLGDQYQLAEQVVLANDHDDPMVEEAFRWGRKIVGNDLKESIQLDTIPFSSDTRYFASLHKSKDHNLIYVNGAPETILSSCTLSKVEHDKVQKTLKNWTAAGRRVIAYAQKTLPSSQSKIVESELMSQLTWVGMIAFTDPVRHSVANALVETAKAGITLKVITGDYAATAKNVLVELGVSLENHEIMLGEDFIKLSPSKQLAAVKVTKLFARTTPDQKYLIIKSLKQQGEIVAMMGDGVNDAPALHLSDIGIVVDSASDVARESADLVLLDSNFATIIMAIRQGRIMFDNIRKIILYLLSDAFAEIAIVVVSIILDLPLPITVAQILWINIISDGVPSLALTIDPGDDGIMHLPPRSPKEPLVTKWMAGLIALVSTVAAALAFANYYYTLTRTGNIEMARTVAFLTLGLNSLSYVFSIRLLTTPFWKTKVFANRHLIFAVIIGFILQAIPMLIPALHDFFSVTTLSLKQWLVAIGLSLSMFFVIEIFKLILNFGPGSMSRKARTLPQPL